MQHSGHADDHPKPSVIEAPAYLGETNHCFDLMQYYISSCGRLTPEKQEAELAIC